ncbi:MAG: hypothetical protein AAF557_05380 [Pseudomonadota bacterium]
MSVERVLNKVVQHNDQILGCILLSSGKVYDNLPERYELVDVLEVAENAESIFELAGTLEAGPNGFDQAFLEFEEYSFFARTLDEGVLVLLTNPIERSAFKKMQVGVNLFMKPLRRELAGQAVPAAPEAESEEVPAKEPKEKQPLSKRIYRGIRY